MSEQMTLKSMTSAISLQASAGGLMRLGFQDGQMIGRYGREAVRASHLAQ